MKYSLHEKLNSLASVLIFKNQKSSPCKSSFLHHFQHIVLPLLNQSCRSFAVVGCDAIKGLFAIKYQKQSYNLTTSLMVRFHYD